MTASRALLDHRSRLVRMIPSALSMKLAARVTRIGESATMKVTRRAAELRARGIDIVSFGAGEPDFPSPAVAVEAARESLAQGFTKYTAATGLEDLRRALLDRYRREWGAPWSALGQAAITVGAKAALFELALAAFDDGDEVIIPSPCWVSFPDQVRLCGGTPVLVPARADDGFRIRADGILAAFTPATRAVLLNSPCNPTGGMIERDDLRRIVEACAARGLLVVSDETYERFVYDGPAFTSCAAFAAEHPDTVAVVGSFSKTYAMTGWRIGWALGPPALLAGLAAIQSHATSNPTSFAMTGALAALQGAEADVRAMIDEFRQRRDLVIDALNAIPGVTCRPPAGAFYAFPRVADRYRGGEGSVEFAERLLEESRVAVVPGAAFGDDAHIRLSFACSRESLREGLDRMARLLERG
ncbi:MAG TPA: pyridoxal phosphate-dependent aminotransferase [Thermoanaerobaculia bacterium]|nr:pyridoxal phosphate-dependent aminotransferase [Thermoanaerobaculia bacterium]